MKHFFSTLVFTLCATTLVMQASHASCGSSNRVDYDDSWCLDADLNSNGGNFFSTSRWELSNLCTGYDHSLKFKVNLRSASDKTYTVGDGDSASGSSRASIRNAHCCTDSGPTINGTHACNFTTKAAWKAAVRAHCPSGTTNTNCDVDNLPD